MKPETDVLAATSAAPAEALPDFQTMSRTDLDSYMKTGDLPKATLEPKTDVIADATDKSGAAPDAAEKPTIPQETKPPNREERRNQKLANELRESKAEIERLKAGQHKEPEKTVDAAVTDDPNEPNIEDLNADGTAKYKTVLEWQRAFKKHLLDTGIKPAVAEAMRLEREAAQKQQQEAEASKATDKLANTFVKRVTEYRKTLTEDTFIEDYAEVHGYLKKHSVDTSVGDYILDSEVGPQLVTYFGEHFEEFEKLTALPLHAALRELGRLELSDKVKGPAPKTRTAAKKIGSNVNGSNSAVSDDDEALAKAAETGNMKEYDRLMKKAGY